MGWQLFCKELKYHFKTMTYYIFIAVVILFYFSQMELPKSINDIKPMSKEQVEEDENKLPEEQRAYRRAMMENSYGRKPMTDIKMKQKAMYNYMENELKSKIANVYKFAFLKKVKLSDKQVNAFKEAMDKISPEKQISDEEFDKALEQLDKALGGGSRYNEQYRESILSINITYEEAMENYNVILKEDKLTNAEGRVFADYMGITAGLFPIFIAAFILIRDMKSGAQEIIFSKKISSLKYVLTKYLAAIVAFIIPYIITASHATLKYSMLAAKGNISIDYFAFYKYTLMWVVPTLMFVTALGMVFAVLFKKPIAAIIVQFLLWCTSISSLHGSYGISKYIIRFNSSVPNTEYMKWAKTIYINRGFYVVLSAAIIFITVLIYNRRRGSVGEKLSIL